MLLTLLGFFSLVSSSHSTNDSSLEDDSGIIWTCVSMLMSRSGIYCTLVAVLLINVFITALNNKKRSRLTATTVEEDQKQWGLMATIWERPQEMAIGSSENPYAMETPETFKERLREAEATIAALKIELDQTLKCKMSLENSLEELERDRSFSDDELLKVKMEGALELENLRKDNSSMTRQLDRAKNEVAELKLQVEVLQREPRISESALRDQQNLTGQLEATREELDAIKAQLKSVTLERDMAVHLTSSQLVKAEMDDQLLNMTHNELTRKRRSEMEERIQEWSVCQTVGETDNLGTMNAMNGEDAGDAHAVCSCRDDTTNMNGDTSLCSNMDRTVSMSEDFSDDEADQEHMVTGSPAFLAFLRSNYGQ